MKALFVEPFMGISGNMFLGALLDLGVPFAYLKNELEKLSLGKYELVFKRVDKCGINSVYFEVDLAIHEHSTEHEHIHNNNHNHEHRNLRDILQIITASGLSNKVKEQASAVFMKLAEAEAKVHGKDIQEIHFHEVGAVDTIIDIVGSVLALEYLNIERIFVGEMQTGRGFVHCAHGLMPIPAPATAELLKRMPYYKGDIEKELVTPTGAALMCALAQVATEMPQGFVYENIGYGAGTWDLPIPNVVRVYLGDVENIESSNKVQVVECNIDDMSSQIFPYIMERVMQTGALDVWLSSIIMKKGRLAHKLSVLCTEELLPEITALLFSETSTLGLRYYKVERETLERIFIKVPFLNNSINVKVGRLAGEVVNVMPEFEDCKKIAEELGLPLKTVLSKAAEQGRLVLHERF
ncbi:MAG: nickel pincer cofactor biosynthesis protein LarC [Acidaminococcaceae bacterium]|nr:nickel pincer cofactor biosynthesis protein LarC [Acidaminococcaceae bacterium]MDD4722861.1 nickel pincer cofactor biosynthesis protein LarC [Acidaminococcaceae bacterium]